MEYLASLLDWIAAHAAWAGPAVFMIALLESLALVGLVVPGAFMMFGVGALIGSGRLEFWPITLWAVAGAIVGDGLSYLLGRLLQDRLWQIPPFRKHPRFLEAGVSFFRRHGGKSVVLGRFVGPLRPVIPAVAGMLRMPFGSFLFTNVISALFWAPAYLLPGLVLVASFSLAVAVAGRLLFLAVVLLLAGWLVLVVSRCVYLRSGPRGRHALWLLTALALVLASVGLGRQLLWQPPSQVQLLSWQDWQTHAWQVAPTHRQGIWKDDDPFAFQIAAPEIELVRALVQTGWQLPQPFDYKGALLWLSPEVDLVRTPPLPQRHNGRPPQLVFVRYHEGGRLVLRAWRSQLAVKAGEWPIWLVAVEREMLVPGWPWLQRTRLQVPAEVLQELREALAARVRADNYIAAPATAPAIDAAQADVAVERR